MYRLRFLAQASTKLQKMHFFGQFKDHNSGKNMEDRQITPFLSSTLSALTVFNIDFCFENSQNSFSCGPSFAPFWSKKCFKFEQKLPILTANHTFLLSRHPEVTKNPYYILPSKRSQKTYQLMDYCGFGYHLPIQLQIWPFIVSIVKDKTRALDS